MKPNWEEEEPNWLQMYTPLGMKLMESFQQTWGCLPFKDVAEDELGAKRRESE
jgi:hypothetical protein